MDYPWLHNSYVIAPCHHSPSFLKQNSRVRSLPTLVIFLNFQDKLKILKLSREKKELVDNGTHDHIYLDFTVGLL